jgi:cell division septation protein DedD
VSTAPHRSALFVLLTVMVSACSRGEPARTASADSAVSGGPDAIVLRLAKAGGFMRAYRYPRLDSLVWRSTEPAPSVRAVLGFDQEDGVLAYLSKNGSPGWIDLRVGSVRAASRVPITGVTTADAWAVYGVRRDTIIQRLTPSGDWSVSLNAKIQRLFPLPDGSLLALRARGGGGAQLLRLRPPESALLDSVNVEAPLHTAVSPLGDRVYFAAQREVIPFGAQTLRGYPRVPLPDDVADMVSTPSGDRLFVALEHTPAIEVIDRFSGARTATVRLPAPARELRMDPLGRMVLVRPATGDSVWVVGVAANRVVHGVASEWREDLPAVVVDGSVAVIQSGDVLFVAPGEARPRMRVQGGSEEVWHFVFWNGFRPRAKELDLPVVFEDSMPRAVETAVAARDSVEPPRPARVDTAPTARAAPAPPVDTAAPRPAAPRAGWTVSFAAVLSEEGARELARRINVDGQVARVVVTSTEGIRIHRVVLGPYTTRVEAERVGRSSGRSFWVFEGPPE